MNKAENRFNYRYNPVGCVRVADFLYISSYSDALPYLRSAGQENREFHSAVVHNISRGGICLSTEDPGLDMGREIELYITLTDPESGTENIPLEFVARVIWVSEDTNGFRAGLKFVEVPEDFPETMERVVMLLEDGHRVR